MIDRLFHSIDWDFTRKEQRSRVCRPMGRGRVRSPAWLATLLLLTGLLGGCGRPEPQPLRFGAAPWGVGESSEYAVTDVNGQAAGITRYEITAGQSSDNGSGWSIRREIAAQGVNETVAVETTDDYRPLTSTVTRSTVSQPGQETVRATYDRGQVDMELTTIQNVTTYERTNIPSDARDSNVLLPIVRALPLAEGYATRIQSFLPIAGLMETFTVSVLDTETVTVPAGTFETFKVELRTNDYTTLAWYAQDAAHLLVKYEDGRNQGTFELTNVQSSE
jgi:hypothetical protein